MWSRSYHRCRCTANDDRVRLRVCQTPRRARHASSTPINDCEPTRPLAGHSHVAVPVAQLDLAEKPAVALRLPQNHRRRAGATRRAARRAVATAVDGQERGGVVVVVRHPTAPPHTRRRRHAAPARAHPARGRRARASALPCLIHRRVEQRRDRLGLRSTQLARQSLNRVEDRHRHTDVDQASRGARAPFQIGDPERGSRGGHGSSLPPSPAGRQEAAAGSAVVAAPRATHHSTRAHGL